jgi:hypothetical protein
MEVPVYGTSWMNKDDKIISLFEHLPESAARGKRAIFQEHL